MSVLEETVGFVGGGKMALAMAQGFVKAGKVDPGKVSITGHIYGQCLIFKAI